MKMKIKNSDISVTKHMVDGFTLFYTADDGYLYHKRYIGYGLRVAKQRFKEYVQNETAKNTAYWQGRADEVVIQALRCVCGGDLGAARQLMGQ